MILIDKAEKCFNNGGSIQPVLDELTTTSELDELREAVKGSRSIFHRAVRVQIKEFQREFKSTIRFKNKVDIIDDLIHVPHILRNGDITKLKFHYLSRALATGAIRELSPVWTGLVSKRAIKNKSKTSSHCKATYANSYLNSYEHFYNNLYAASVVLCYKLYFTEDRKVLEQMCDVFRQVHITTAKENSMLAHNGQNEDDRMGWSDAYNLNNIQLVDVGLTNVKVLKIRDVAPEGLIEMTMDKRTGRN